MTGSPGLDGSAMGRIASLDLLRGVAALAVAIPHYVMLGSTGWTTAEVVSILAVEVFFVLSGFVLAPQLLQCLQSARRSDIGVFLMRRWMRTVPPYLVALLIITFISGNIYADELLLYALYIQNFAWQLPEGRDYFAIAWSLSIEEWFYVVFAAIVLGARALGFGRRQFLLTVIAFALIVTGARLAFGDMGAWDAEVRRIVIFRLDAIAFGFILYCAQPRLFDGITEPGRKHVPLLLALIAAGLAFACGWKAVADASTLARHLYPFAAAFLGAAVIFALVAYRRPLSANPTVEALSFFLGKVSYTIYLFHIIAILLLRPHLEALPLALQLTVYVAALIAFCWVFYTHFEAPILSARPRYGGSPRQSGAIAVATSSMVRRARARMAKLSLPDALARAATLAVCIGCFAVLEPLFLGGPAYGFYLALLGSAAALVAVAMQWGFWRSGFMRTLTLTWLFIAASLPVADRLFAMRTGIDPARQVEPVYSFREATGDPAAFTAWWTRYTNEWLLGAKANIQTTDPDGVLPFILRPNARSAFFEAEVHINNAGFRGRDIEKAKGERYRIFVVGESPTFGTMIQAGDRSWPEVLEALIDDRLRCARPVEVINAGVPGYSLPHNIERIRRAILPLQPDMLISYHGYNGLFLVDPVLGKFPEVPIRKVRSSPLLTDFRFQMQMARHAKRVRAFAALRPQNEFSRQYYQLYQELIDLARDNRVELVLANLATAVKPSSPQAVRDFYGQVFQPIDRILSAVGEHNRIVEAVAQSTDVAFVDTRPGLHGVWDQDLFIDVVHFTQKGSDRLAETFYASIAPRLQQDANLRCMPKVAAK